MFTPMLATDVVIEKLRFPILASAKLDGVRAVVRDGKVYSRSNKLIPNLYVQKLFGFLEHFDGELIVGNPSSPTCYRDTVSGVMTVAGYPEVYFYVFDHIEHIKAPYSKRHQFILQSVDYVNVVKHPQWTIDNEDALLECENWMLSQGFEGLILRDIDAPYKCGRSTVKEGYLLKLKRFTDDEATVIGFEERLHNANEAIKNELGHTSRSSHQENKIGRGDLGALKVQFGGIEFSIGTGLNDSERTEIWNNRDKYLGKLVKFKYFKVGMKDAPRHPVFLGWRDPIDL